LRTLPDVIDVDAGRLSANASAGGVTFVTTLSTDQTRYSGRFAMKAGK
jgi:hypothetical protein